MLSPNLPNYRRANRVFNAVAFACLIPVAAWLICTQIEKSIERHRQAVRQPLDEEQAQREAAQLREQSFRPHIPPKIERLDDMPTQGPINADSYVDAGGAGIAWDTTGGTGGTALSIGPGTTNILRCLFNADDFTIPTVGYRVASITISFTASGGTDLGGPSPTISMVEISLGPDDKSDGASLSFAPSTFTYGGDLWGAASITSASVNGAWEVHLAVTANGAGGEQTSISISDVKATVAYELIDLVVPPWGVQSGPQVRDLLCDASGAVIFRAGFADTPVPTPLNPHPLAAGLPQGSEILAAEAFAGSVRYAKGFEDSLPVVAPPPVIAGRADQDLWQTTLLGGAALARYSVPFDPLPAVPPSTVQVVGFAPGLGLPFDAAEGRLAIFRGTVPPETPASQLLPPHIVGLGPSDDLPAGHFEGGVIFGRGWFEAPTPTFCPPPPHIVAWPLGVELLDAWRGAAITAHGFDDAFPQRPAPPAVVGWPQGVEMLADHRGAVLAGHGFSDASPVLPIRPVVIGQQDGQLALLAAGQAISFQTDVTPQPAPPTPACVVAQPPAADLGPLLAGWQGVALSAKGFAGAQPFSPQPSFIVAAAPDFESLQGQLAGSSISARGFARAEPALSPVTAILASEPPPTSLFAGDVLHIVGDEPKPDFPPVRTVYAAAPWCEEFLQPAGAVLAARGFRGAQPDSPTPSIVAAEPVGVELQAQLGSGAVLSGRGFARAEPAALPAPCVVSTLPLPVEAFEGRAIFTHATIEATPAPVEASRGAIVASEPPPPERLAGAVLFTANRVAPQDAYAPAATMAYSDDVAPLLSRLAGGLAETRRGSFAPAAPCAC